MIDKPKRHKCGICSKAFVRSDLLRRHENRHKELDNDEAPVIPEPSAESRANSHSIEVENGSNFTQMDDDQMIRWQSQHVVDTTVSQVHGPPPIDQPLSESIACMPPNITDLNFMFFEPFENAQGQQDLNWLFEGGLSDLDFDRGSILDAQSTVSPLSTTSCQFITDDSLASTDHWVAVRSRLVTALSSIPASVLQSSFFEPSNLHLFKQLYFQHYNAHFPILHEPTFDPTQTPPLLMATVLTLGATLSEDDAHFATAQQLHDSLRWLIFASDDFQPPAPLFCIQALLLVQAHGKMFSSRAHHEKAHIFHGSIITLMRRGSSYSGDWAEASGETPSLERAWLRWIDRESLKRAAFFAFVMDAQHSSVFSHVPALSVSDLRMSLPCSDTIWEATTPTHWKHERHHAQPEVSFLQVLRRLLTRRPLPAALSPFSRFIVLHGLFSITKHMQYREIVLRDVESENNLEPLNQEYHSSAHESGHWREALDRAIETWSLSLLSQGPSLCLEAAAPLQRLAHISIHVNLSDFHILAGAPSLSGNQASPTEQAAAKQRCQQWRNSPVARRTLSHCLLLVQETMFRRTRYRAANDNIALRPWCLYHATLIIWAYGASSSASLATDDLSAEDYVVSMLSGLMDGNGLLEHASSTSGLIAAVRDCLIGCRWELLSEAYETLCRLLHSSSRSLAGVQHG